MDGYYERLEDVPEGLEDFTIMDDKVNTKHFTFHWEINSLLQVFF